MGGVNAKMPPMLSVVEGLAIVALAVVVWQLSQRLGASERQLAEMRSVRRQQDVVARPNLQQLLAPLDAAPCGAAQQDRPLVGVLVVPLPRRRGVALRHDPLDEEPLAGPEYFHRLRGRRIRRLGEQVAALHG